MEVTHEQRLELLKAHNDLRDILQTIFDCQDLWISDVSKLERIQCSLHQIFKFVPQEDENGMSRHYADWVLAEEDDD
tara:strand:+ start:420 stop:650 length:231 start_codon:yes stop_codon:yes gene_type:complete